MSRQMLASVAHWLVYPKLLATGGVVHSLIIFSAIDSGAPSDSTLKVSLIAGVALVLAAAVPNIITLFKKPEPFVESKAAEDLRRANAKIISDLESELHRERETRMAAVRGIEIRDGELDRLRKMIIDLGANPFPQHVTEGDAT